MTMTAVDLRAKIHTLMDSGALPKEPPVIHRAGKDSVWARRREACTICADPDLMVSYFWPGGLVVRLPAACDALWKQEQSRAK